MKRIQCLLLASLVTLASCQLPQTTPVPILKQINKQNDDGSYSFGYEAADGSFKIETKYPNGDVAGKYGYVDANGKQREISYGASSKRGFEPQGEGIMVPPPSLGEPTNELLDGDVDDGQYREDPKIYEDPKYNSRPTTNFRQTKQPIFSQFHQPSAPQPTEQYSQINAQPSPARQFQQLAQPQYQQQGFDNQYQQQNLLPSFPNFGPGRPQTQIYHQQPQFSYQAQIPAQGYQKQQYEQPSFPQYRQTSQFPQSTQYQPQIQPFQSQNYYQPQSYQQQQFNPFAGHPAQNFDPSSGSYTINFTG